MYARNVTLAIALTGMVCVAYAEDTAQPEFIQYAVRMELYRVLEDAWSSFRHGDELAPTRVGTTIRQFADSGQKPLMIGNQKLEIVDDHPVWNGEDNLADPSIMLLSRPSVMARAGVPFEIRIDEPPVEYFRPAGPDKPDLFVHGVSDPLGVKVMMTVSPASSGDVKMGTSIDIRLLAKRVKLQGVSLDVGLPVISQRTMSGEVMMPSGQWFWIAQSAVDQGGLLILLKVSGVARQVTREPDPPQATPDPKGPVAQLLRIQTSPPQWQPWEIYWRDLDSEAQGIGAPDRKKYPRAVPVVAFGPPGAKEVTPPEWFDPAKSVE